MCFFGSTDLVYYWYCAIFIKSGVAENKSRQMSMMALILLKKPSKIDAWWKIDVSICLT
jgi:hypothetical protein